MVLVLLGAGLAAAASFQETYGTFHRQPGLEVTYMSTLWIVTSNHPAGDPITDPYLVAGWPVMIAAIVMAIAVVLMVRERTASIARPLGMGAAGALAGIVFFYVTQVQHEEDRLSSWPVNTGQENALHYFAGMYLLVAAAIIGLVGAALAQQKQQQQEPEDEEEIVVHQLDSDDDTPPFGIAMLEQERTQEEQETR